MGIPKTIDPRDGAILVLAGVVLELARRELGGLGPQGLTGERVTLDGLARLGVTEPVPTAAAAVELAVKAIREASVE